MQSISVETAIRNEYGVIVYQDSVNSGLTNDGGKTITIPLGYLPNIDKTEDKDIKIIFNETGEVIYNASFIDRINDYESETSIITLLLN